jgi:acetyltransferase-like isoleucine patch superfamily enzyme
MGSAYEANPFPTFTPSPSILHLYYTLLDPSCPGRPVKIGDGCQIGPSCHFYTPVSPDTLTGLLLLYKRNDNDDRLGSELNRATRLIPKNAGRTSNGRPRSRSVSPVQSEVPVLPQPVWKRTLTTVSILDPYFAFETEHDVWLGGNVTVLGGVTIGHGSTVGE